MSKLLETVPETEHTITLADGSELRVSLTAVSDAETHYGVNVRQWVTKSSAERYGVVAGKGRARSTYTGPDGRHGLSLLSPWQAAELADLLARLAVEAETLEYRAEGVA